MGNICKFIDEQVTLSLVTKNFILETDKSVMESKEKLDTNAMYLVIEGEGDYSCGGAQFTVRSGDLFFSFEDEPFGFSHIRGLKYMYIAFTGSRSSELFARFGVNKANCVFRGFESLIPVWKEALLKCGSDNIDLVTESLLLNSFSRLTGFESVKADAVTLALGYLEENYSEADLSLASTAKKLGYNEKYLSHCFSKAMGSTFSEYLKLMRMKQAVFLMENGVTTVKNVAYLVGYRDPLYFSRVFASVMGKTPKDYLRDLH